MDSENDILLEPCESYNKYYKAKFSENANELFDELVKKSGIDAEENRKTAAEYRCSKEQTDAAQKKLSRLKVGRILLWVLAAIALLFAIIGISNGDALMIIIPLLICGGAVALIFAVLNKKIKEAQERFNSSDSITNDLYKKACDLIAPLIDLFESDMTRQLVQKTVPMLEIDKNFDMRRYDYLNGKYGYAEDDGNEISTVGVMSGQIIGNPFVFEKKLIHAWGTQTYEGSLEIHWTTTRVVDGRVVTEHHSQTLHASVVKPRPFFHNHTDLVYGNEAAPDLSFSRYKTHCETMSESKLKSFVKSRVKKIKKYAKKHIDSGFTELGNDEFDAIYGALDRDHEVQFRLLFTPLAQKNLLKIMKGESPYGDDFNFVKSKCINVVVSDHSQNWQFSIDVSQYYSYDIDISKKAFVTLNESYFQSIFFDFAPLLSIPMYQQIKPKEYIYKDSYYRNYTVRQTEVMANSLGQKALAHPLSVTPAILKTRLISTQKDIDRVSVHALSYKTITRVDFVPVRGGDGNIHNVPVPWLQYIPLQQETEIELKALDMSEREYRHSDYAADKLTHSFRHSIFATLGKITNTVDEAPNETDTDTSEYGDIKEAASDAGNNQTDFFAGDDE